jgi:predicted 3-demethylubiquinone-9 3-methyltransferase (glyoxalase superfamily)
MPNIQPCLWFDTQAEEAAKFYCSVFPNSKITRISHYTDVGPRPKGMVLTVEFVLDGKPFMALNGGPEFKFTEAISISIECDTQEEIDRYWSALQAGGGTEIECGWLKDRFGLSWQVSPKKMSEIITGPDPEKADRAMRAMLTMKKIVLADIEEAVRG